MIAIVATALGSLGLPLYQHSCRMIAAETKEAGCPMCSSRESNLPVQHDTSDDDGGCCSDNVVNQSVDDGTMMRVAMPAPMLVVVAGSFTLLVPDLCAPFSKRNAFGESPPSFAARRQHTYLLNSTFLI
ncbi:MAG: hypothetical protein H7X80_04940 [bacterium]|nr:hypothetical protein [Candidatus Kapabacteria bacterium]